MGMSIFAVIQGIIAAIQSGLPAVDAIKQRINALREDRELTAEEAAELEAMLDKAVEARENRVPLTDRFEDPSAG